MSRTINSIEINSISYENLITIIDKTPVNHLEEVPFGNYQMTLDLVHEVYTSTEALGYTKCYIVYVKGNFAGYMLIMASEMSHYRDVIQATTDSFYVKPEYRSSGVFAELLSYVEKDLLDNNIRFLTLGINPNMPHVDRVHKFVNDLGYVPTSTTMTKELT